LSGQFAFWRQAVTGLHVAVGHVLAQLFDDDFIEPRSGYRANLLSH
jgi:hypothetical protein